MNLRLACCTQLIDLGTHASSNLNESNRHQKLLTIGWELISEQQQTQDHQNLLRYKEYTFSLNPNSELRRDLEKWLPNMMNDESLRRFNLKSVLGKFCYLGLVNLSSIKDRGQDQIIEIFPASSSSTKSSNQRPVSRIQMFMMSEPDIDFLNSLPSAIQEKIRSSIEFKAWQKSHRAN
jgi:hypothetical protein